jgi:hypothetical protein
MTRRIDAQARPQWVYCRACDVAFQLPITLPCEVKVWCFTLKKARCPVCGVGAKRLTIFDDGGPTRLDEETTTP